MTVKGITWWVVATDEATGQQSVSEEFATHLEAEQYLAEVLNDPSYKGYTIEIVEHGNFSVENG